MFFKWVSFYSSTVDQENIESLNVPTFTMTALSSDKYHLYDDP